tara:strand:+ start:345 stop:773 length:429 start_codon:yes stop_codon:yes gene_type:complete
MIAFAQLSDCRELFFQQPSLQNWEKLMAKAKNIESETLSQAFAGAAKCSTAEYRLNPFSKLNTFNAGTDEIEQAVKTDPENAEIRFLRLCIQMESPGFLNYNSKINEDSALVWKALEDKTWPGTKDYLEKVLTYLKKKELKP